jgi:hypothetical protein
MESPTSKSVKLVDRPLPPCTANASPVSAVLCDVVPASIWEYLDGASSALTLRAIDAHLKSCPDCHAQYEFQQAFLRCMARTVSISLA